MRTAKFEENNLILHENRSFRQEQDHLHYEVKILEHDPAAFWENVAKSLLGKSSREPRFTLEPPFRIKLMGETMGPIMVVKQEGFIFFKNHENDSEFEPLNALLQYISPLRGDFEIDTDSEVWYLMDNYNVIVEWKNMHLKQLKGFGSFTFQCKISPNGQIAFVYKKIPGSLKSLTKSSLYGYGDTSYGPVIVGLSSRTLASGITSEFTHKHIEVDLDSIKSGTRIVFAPKVACSDVDICSSCVKLNHCQWCNQSCDFKQGPESSSQCLSNCDREKYYKIKSEFSPEQVKRLWSPSPNILPHFSMGNSIVNLSFDFPFFGSKTSHLKVMQNEPRIYFGNDSDKYLSLMDLPAVSSSAPKVKIYHIGTHDLLIKWEDLQVHDGFSRSQNCAVGTILNARGSLTLLYKESHENTMFGPSSIKINPFLVYTYQAKHLQDSQPFVEELFALTNVYSKSVREDYDSSSSANLIKSGTVVTFLPLETCLDFLTCHECINANKPIPCQWKNGKCFNFDGHEMAAFECPLANQTIDESLIRPEYEHLDELYYKLETATNANQWVELDENLDKLDTVEEIFGRKLEFAFTFYGHPVDHVLMLKEGTLSLGGLQLENLYESQYIAPLMTSQPQKELTLMSRDDGKVGIFTWKLENLQTAFQVQLYASGEIKFVYKNLHHLPRLLRDLEHPVQVGLSDAYLLERHSGLVTQKNLVTYHKIDAFNELDLKAKENQSEITLSFKPKMTCNLFKSCWDCMTHATEFNCVWCPSLNLCSNDGLDRNYQQWANEMCYVDKNSVNQLEKCPVSIKKSSHAFYNQTTFANPRMSLSVTRIVTTMHSYACVSPTEKKMADLPFPFRFYNQVFHKVIISPLGFISFLDEDNQPFVTASIVVYLNASEILKNVIHSIVTYGSSSVERDDFVVKWNHSFEAILHKDGHIDLKYYSVQRR